MTHKEANERIVKILPDIKNKCYKEKVTGKSTKVEGLIAKTKDEKNPDNWDIYAIIEMEKISEGWHNYSEIRYSLFQDKFEKQD